MNKELKTIKVKPIIWESLMALKYRGGYPSVNSLLRDAIPYLYRLIQRKESMPDIPYNLIETRPASECL